MKKWRVHLHQEHITCGEVEVEADTEDEAEKKALLSRVDWQHDGDTHVEVDWVKELDEDGHEIE